jgi:anaerobic selenocysteine-containing dehydrogenase
MDPAFGDDDLTLIEQALRGAAGKRGRMQGVTMEALLEHGWVRLNLPRPYLPFAEGGYFTPSGKCEFYSERMARQGMDPLPTYTPPAESPESAPALAERYPLTLISSPRHQFLNSTFVNVPSLTWRAEPECHLHEIDARVRGIVEGARVVVHNDRGEFTAVARVGDAVRPGVAWAPGIWWGKMAPDGQSVNATTSQRETDLGHGPVFYDNLVDVSNFPDV